MLPTEGAGNYKLSRQYAYCIMQYLYIGYLLSTYGKYKQSNTTALQ